MTKKLHLLLLGAYLYNPLRALAAVSPPPPSPISPVEKNLCDGAGIGANCTSPSGPSVPLQNRVATISETLLTVAGAIAVIIIIIGGITYITSNGDASRVKQAKDTILYAVIGLVAAIMAFAIVSFVANRI